MAGDRDKGNGAVMAQMAFRSPVPPVVPKLDQGVGGQHSAATLTRSHSPALPVSSFVFLGESHDPLGFGFLIRRIQNRRPVRRLGVRTAQVLEDTFLKAGSS